VVSGIFESENMSLEKVRKYFFPKIEFAIKKSLHGYISADKN